MLRLLVLVVLGYMSPGHASSAAGGYGRSRWGMTVAQVRALYPGGVVHSVAAGTVATAGSIYYQTRAVVTDRPAVISFAFDTNRLRSAGVIFLAAGTTADLGIGGLTYTPPTVDESVDIRTALNSGLKIKYGKPVSSWTNPSKEPPADLSGANMVREVWAADAHTCVELIVRVVGWATATGGSEARAPIILVYRDCLSEATQGL